MKLRNFYQKFDTIPREERFQPITSVEAPTSLFVIFQRLTVVRAQKKYFEDQERHLLAQAELGFKQLEGGE